MAKKSFLTVVEAFSVDLWKKYGTKEETSEMRCVKCSIGWCRDYDEMSKKTGSI